MGSAQPLLHVDSPPHPQIFGLSSVEEIEQGAREVSGGFVGLAVFSFVAYFLAVCDVITVAQCLSRGL